MQKHLHIKYFNSPTAKFNLSLKIMKFSPHCKNLTAELLLRNGSSCQMWISSDHVFPAPQYFLTLALVKVLVGLTSFSSLVSSTAPSKASRRLPSVAHRLPNSQAPQTPVCLLNGEKWTPVWRTVPYHPHLPNPTRNPSEAEYSRSRHSGGWDRRVMSFRSVWPIQ